VTLLTGSEMQYTSGSFAYKSTHYKRTVLRHQPFLSRVVGADAHKVFNALLLICHWLWTLREIPCIYNSVLLYSLQKVFTDAGKIINQHKHFPSQARQTSNCDRMKAETSRQIPQGLAARLKCVSVLKHVFWNIPEIKQGILPPGVDPVWGQLGRSPSAKPTKVTFFTMIFLQFVKQHSRYKAILSSIVLPQQCCEVYFIFLTVE